MSNKEISKLKSLSDKRHAQITAAYNQLTHVSVEVPLSSQAEGEDILKEIPSKPGIYCICFETKLDSDSTKRKFRERYKDAKIKLRLPPYNFSSNQDNKTLYIGKSNTSLYGRLREHLAKSSESTWSLKLNKWFWKSLVSDSLKLPMLKIEYYFFDGDIKDKDIIKSTLLDLEQVLARKHKPMLGKH